MMVVARCIKTMAFKLDGKMNERTLELAVEANDQTGNKFDLNYKELDSFLEKFAELIVRECIDVVDVGGEFVSRPKMVERLKQHFGVEND